MRTKGINYIIPETNTFPTKQTLMCSIRDIVSGKTIEAIPSEMTYEQMARERDRQKAALFAKYPEASA